MKLVYDGPHQAVDVPLGDALGGFIVAERGQVVEIPDDIAEGLLEQGADSAEGAAESRPWKVDVPLGDALGGFIVAERGQVVEIPDDIAEGLLEQGADSAEGAAESRPWKVDEEEGR